eukprot:Seg5063.1 transcript_id=Seg5063.1/GoldUCD/mRNA.D3Y31 product="hypothetical protein" protein_id=Seg5063.1/GoldUCD/D3Y31
MYPKTDFVFVSNSDHGGLKNIATNELGFGQNIGVKLAREHKEEEKGVTLYAINTDFHVEIEMPPIIEGTDKLQGISGFQPLAFQLVNRYGTKQKLNIKDKHNEMWKHRKKPDEMRLLRVKHSEVRNCKGAVRNERCAFCGGERKEWRRKMRTVLRPPQNAHRSFLISPS